MTQLCYRQHPKCWIWICCDCYRLSDFFSTNSLSPEKSEPLKDFATTCVNLHQIKYIFTLFTHIQPHLFQTMFQSFWKITVTQTRKSNCKQNCKRLLTFICLETCCRLTYHRKYFSPPNLNFNPTKFCKCLLMLFVYCMAFVMAFVRQSKKFTYLLIDGQAYISLAVLCFLFQNRFLALVLPNLNRSG